MSTNPRILRLHDHLYLWCPGCDDLHMLEVGRNRWTLTFEAGGLSVQPSILVRGGRGQFLCHSFIKDGKWKFLVDSTHPLSGQTVPMIPLPDWLLEERNKGVTTV